MGQFRVCWTVPEDGPVPPLPPGSSITARGFYADVTATDTNQAMWAVAKVTAVDSTFTGITQSDAQQPA